MDSIGATAYQGLPREDFYAERSALLSYSIAVIVTPRISESISVMAYRWIRALAFISRKYFVFT